MIEIEGCMECEIKSSETELKCQPNYFEQRWRKSAVYIQHNFHVNIEVQTNSETLTNFSETSLLVLKQRGHLYESCYEITFFEMTENNKFYFEFLSGQIVHAKNVI